MKSLLLTLALLGVAACNSHPEDSASAATPPASIAASPVASKAGTPDVTPPPTPTPKPAPYEVHGIVDPGMNNLIAFALKIPHGWRMRQSFTREWNGATPVNQIYVHVTAPDGQRQIEFLPERPYYFVDGPMARQGRQMAAMYGAPQTTSPYEAAPMSAMTYLKRILLPRLAQRGLHLAISGEHEQALPPKGAATRRSSAYVDGRLPNGRLARIECQVNITPTNVNGDTYYNWSALPTITQSSTDLAATFAYVAAARTSLVFNPAWVQQNQQLVSNGQRSNQVENEKRRVIVQDFQNYQKKTNDEITANRQQSQDRINESFGDALRGQAKYEDPTTGERVKVDDYYNHVYRNAQGTTLSTNVPLDASQVDWQELQRVETKNY